MSIKIKDRSKKSFIQLNLKCLKLKRQMTKQPQKFDLKKKCKFYKSAWRI